MYFDLSYADASTRYPEQVADIIDKLRKSKSKEKQAAAEDLKWQLSWCESIRGSTIEEVFGLEEKPPEPTGDQRIDNSRVYLTGKIKHWSNFSDVWNGPSCGNSRDSMGQCPPEVVNVIREQERDKEQRKTEWEAKTPEQKEQEIQELLVRLRGWPGFIEFRS